jgi:hypothetical protein
MSAATAAPSPKHLSAKDALVRFSSLRSDLKRHSVTAAAGGGRDDSAAASVVPGPGCAQGMASAPFQTNQQTPLPPLDNQQDADDEIHSHADDSDCEVDLGRAGPVHDWVEDGDPCFEDIGLFTTTQDSVAGWGARGA